MARQRQDSQFKAGSKDRDPRLNSSIKGEARKLLKAQIKAEIQNELYDWVIMQPEDRYKEIPVESSAFLYFPVRSIYRNEFSCRYED